MLLIDDLPAAATLLAEALGIHDLEGPSREVDQAALPEFVDHLGQRRPLSAEHLGQELMGDVVRHRPDTPVDLHQPARRPLRQTVKAVAEHELGDLHERHLGVPLQQADERAAPFELAPETFRRESLGGHLDLDERGDRHLARAQEDGQPDESLPPDHQRVDGLAFRARREEGRDTTSDEVDLRDVLVGTVEDVTALELDRGEVRLEARVLVGRKSAEKEVPGLTLGRHACVPLRHANSVRPPSPGRPSEAFTW